MNQGYALDQLALQICSPKSTTTIVRGLGGIGKTALVSYALKKYRFNIPFKTKWISFYEQPSQQDLKGFLNALKEGFNSNKSLVVLDGAEAIEEKYLLDLVTAINKEFPLTSIVITTRSSLIIENALYITLSGLSLHHSMNVLQNFEHNLTSEELNIIANKLSGHPLALSLTGNLLKQRSFQEIINSIEGELYNYQSVTKIGSEQIIEVVSPTIINSTEVILNQLKNNSKQIYNISPREFECVIAELLRDMGFEIELTKSTRDGGIDIFAYVPTEIGNFLCLVEAKRYRSDRPVGVELVRNLYGSFCDHQANSALLVTTSYFTKDAKEFQSRHKYQINLKDYFDINSWLSRYAK